MKWGKHEKYLWKCWKPDSFLQSSCSYSTHLIYPWVDPKLLCMSQVSKNIYLFSTRADISGVFSSTHGTLFGTPCTARNFCSSWVKLSYLVVIYQSKCWWKNSVEPLSSAEVIFRISRVSEGNLFWEFEHRVCHGGTGQPEPDRLSPDRSAVWPLRRLDLDLCGGEWCRAVTRVWTISRARISSMMREMREWKPGLCGII